MIQNAKQHEHGERGGESHRSTGPGGTVRLYGRAESAEAYAIRDFLKRSVVDFDWTELRTDEQARREAGVDALDDPRLPVCILPSGDRLFAPSVRSVADRLGWVTRSRHDEYDVSIYGAGPAGLSAAVYAASEGLRTVLIERHAVGGQAGSSSKIENYLGFPGGISGADLAERARQQAVDFGADILLMREGVNAEFHDGKIVVDLSEGVQMVARTNICATGVEYRRLGLPDEERFLGAGLYYGTGVSESAMCLGEHVYVVGGGNSAGQAVMDLSAHARCVTMLIRAESPAASLSAYLLDRIRAAPNVEVRTCTEVAAVDGDGALAAITLRDNATGREERADTSRLFVLIGGHPNTEWAEGTGIVRDPAGYLVTGPDLLTNGRSPDVWPLDRLPYHLETSVPGSFAAGDVRHGSVKRVASAVGEGAMAVQFVHEHLKRA